VTIAWSPLVLTLIRAASGLQPLDWPSTPPASTVIAVIVPDAAEPSMLDALSRLRGEADSVGFAIRLVESPVGADPLAQIGQVASGMSPAAVVALQERRQGQPLAAIDVWFFDRATGKTSVGHLQVDNDAGDRAELALAVRVVDFIRARMFDSLVRSSAKPAKPPVRNHEAVGAHYVALGVGATGSFSGFSSSLAPSIEAGFGVTPRLRLVASASGFGSKPRVEGLAGSATIDQELLVLALSLRGRTWWRFFPLASAGVSALFLSVHGEGKPGYLGHDASTWSPGVFASAGAGAVIASHVQLHLTGGAMLLVRQPKIFINEVEVARTGRPTWIASLSLGVSF
jgi:hypothetical protein